MTKNSRILLCLLTLIFGIIFAHKASALSGSTYINKAYLEGVYTCWTGHLKNAPITQNDFPVFSGNFPDRIFKDNDDGTVLIPRVLSGLDENDLGCVDLMAGSDGSFGGVVSMSGATQPKNDSAPSEKTAFMKNIGYSTEKTTSSTGKCASFNFKANSGNRETRSGSLCLTDLTNDEKITSNTKVEISDDSGGGNFTLQDMIMFKPINGGVTVSYDTYSENCTQTNLGKTCSGYVKRRVSEEFKVADYSTFDSFMSGTDGIAGLFNSQPPSLCAGYYQLACTDYTLDITKSDSIYNPSTMDESMVQYVVEDKTVAANTAIKYFSGSEELKDWASLKYTDAEKAHLYQDYINKVFEASFADNSCPSLSDSQAALLEDSGYSKVKWNFNSGGAKTCYIKASEKTVNKEVVGIKENGHFGKKMKFGDLITTLDSITLADGEFNDVADDDSSNGEVEPTCANSGGAESLGWIVCPILNWLKNAATEVYEKALEPNLRIEPKLFTDADGGAERAWSFFQGMANVLFVILFLVVIFSQLTGVGIDNYGIKKIMPKLIVVAILINLSYLLCVLCVDLSNIVGNGLHNLFDNLPTGSPDGSVAAALGSGAGATAITSVILLAGLGGGALVTWKNPAILISLLIGALGVVIAIFFVFVLLAMREAAVVVLTVISPLAFACYMLPNTKKMYDKWLKFWEGLLLLYPICGALIGGGNFVSNLLLSAGIATQGFWSALTAMLVGIIPIFFIPAALKGAFAAMGTIGSKITGFGDRARSRVTSGARNSDIYKNMQERGRETGIRRRAGYDKNGNRRWGENGPSGFQKFIRGGSRNIERNAQAYQKLQAEKGSLAATNGPDYMLATETANEAKRIVSSGEINTIGKIGAGGLTDGLYKALMSGDRAKINAYSDALSAKGENGRDAVRSAYDKAVGAGMSGTAAKTLANNIMANHAADYKNNNRAMFNVAQSINSGEGGPIDTVSNYAGGHRADLAGKVTASTIGTMDDSAFNEIFGNGEIPAGANSAAIGEIAYKAMSTQNANIKSDRMAKLKKIVESSGYDAPDVQGTNNTGTPKPITVPGAAQEGQAFDVHSLDSDTLLDIATSPNISDNDPNRQAAVEELGKRNIK